MSAVSPPTPAASQQAAVEAALLLLERMGLSPADLVAAPKDRAVVPTFAEYVPVVSAAVSAGTRRAYGSYWNRIVEHWGARRLDEPTPVPARGRGRADQPGRRSGPQGGQAAAAAVHPAGRAGGPAGRDQPDRRDHRG
jgi:hypothetical protein